MGTTRGSFGFVGDQVKAQGIRILDVVLIGPLMIYGGSLIPKRYELTRLGLQMFGVSTMVYNAQNYLKVKQKLETRSLTRTFPIDG